MEVLKCWLTCDQQRLCDSSPNEQSALVSIFAHYCSFARPTSVQVNIINQNKNDSAHFGNGDIVNNNWAINLVQIVKNQV